MDTLISATPLPELIWDDALAIAAQDHCNDAGSNGIESGTGSDGSSVNQRIARYGRTGGLEAENINLGNVKPIDIVMSLFIDDDFAGREHRKALLSLDYQVTGIAFCPHNSSSKRMVDIVYADSMAANALGRSRISELERERGGILRRALMNK